MSPFASAIGVAAKACVPEKHKKFDRPFSLSIGPQRSATSWLDRYLRSRGDICLPRGVKEVFYFDRNFKRGFIFYKRHYKTAQNHRMIMEISTTSFDHPEAPARVFKTFGDQITLICPLRNPVDRSYSLYLHYLRYGFVKGSLQDACAQKPQILESSRYAKNLRRWLDYYPGNQIKVIFQEDLEKNQDFFLNQLCEALKIPFMPAQEALSSRYNVTTASRSVLLANFAQKIADFLRQNRLYSVINLAKTLGIKRLIFGTEKPDISSSSMPEQDRLWLESALSGEIGALESLLGPISQWR
jgi:hypothetical protein